jgi:hypothetical protein
METTLTLGQVHSFRPRALRRNGSHYLRPSVGGGMGRPGAETAKEPGEIKALSSDLQPEYRAWILSTPEH